MRKIIFSVIGLAVSLGSAYLMLERQQKALGQLQNTAALASAMKAPGVAGATPPGEGSATPAMDGMPPGVQVQDESGNPVDLSSLPPEARAAIEQQMQAMKSGGPGAAGIPALPGMPSVPEMARSAPPPLPRDVDTSSHKFSYRDRNDRQTTSFASGWTVALERKLSDRYTGLADQVMSELERQLNRAAGVLPRAAVEELRKVPIHIGYEGSGTAPMRFHWPDEKDLDPALAGVIEIPKARDFLDAAPRQPWLALHELASAWHQKTLGSDHAAVRNAYQEAVRLGSYKQVKLADGRPGRSMALASERAFFAELTKSFYGRGDAYPFVREEFQQYDPVSARVIEAAWNKR